MDDKERSPNTSRPDTKRLYRPEPIDREMARHESLGRLPLRSGADRYPRPAAARRHLSLPRLPQAPGRLVPYVRRISVDGGNRHGRAARLQEPAFLRDVRVTAVRYI